MRAPPIADGASPEQRRLPCAATHRSTDSNRSQRNPEKRAPALGVCQATLLRACSECAALVLPTALVTWQPDRHGPLSSGGSEVASLPDDVWWSAKRSAPHPNRPCRVDHAPTWRQWHLPHWQD